MIGKSAFGIYVMSYNECDTFAVNDSTHMDKRGGKDAHDESVEERILIVILTAESLEERRTVKTWYEAVDLFESERTDKAIQ